MFTTSSTAGPLPSLQTLDRLARQSGLIMRRSPKFSAAGFLLSLIQSTISGKGSLNHIASSLGHFQPQTLSKQALHQRINESTSAFLLSVIGELLSTKTKSLFTLKKNLPFRRFLVEDCTTLAMHKVHHECFPGNGNGQHHTAGAKIHLLTDYLSGEVLTSALYPARTADQGLAYEVMEHAQKDDLIVRDRGYFSIDSLRAIEKQGAFWLSRLPASINTYDHQGTLLQERLKTEKRNRLEINVTLGAKDHFSCRLVAERLPKKEAEKNRRQRRRASLKHNRVTSQQGLLYDDWRLLITNLSKTQATAKQLQHWYALRWHIEITFRGFKQSMHLRKALGHRRDHYQLEALILASMIYHLTTFQTYRRICTALPEKEILRVSYEKLCHLLSEHFLKLTRDTQHRLFDPDPRHIKHDRRKRLTLRAISLQSLT